MATLHVPYTIKIDLSAFIDQEKLQAEADRQVNEWVEKHAASLAQEATRIAAGTVLSRAQETTERLVQQEVEKAVMSVIDGAAIKAAARSARW